MVKTVMAMTWWLIDRGGYFFKNTGPVNGGPTGLLLSNVTKATGISPYYFLQGIFPLLVCASICRVIHLGKVSRCKVLHQARCKFWILANKAGGKLETTHNLHHTLGTVLF